MKFYGLLIKLNRVLLTFLMVLAWSGWFYCPAMAANADAAAELAARRQASVKRLTSAFGALEAGLKQIPTDTFSLSNVASTIGNDPAVVSGWIRQHTVWVPYVGALRGPLGVLMDRRGNSLDRATLLAELLWRDGKSVRLVHGPLTQAASEKLLTTLLPRQVEEPVVDTKTSAQTLAELTKQYAVPFGIDSAELRKYAQDFMSAGQRRAEDILQRTTSQTAVLSTMLLRQQGADDGKAGQLSDTQKSSLAQTLRDHWWVKVQDAAGWNDVDLEPVDGPLPQATEAIDWNSKDGVYPLAAAQCHEVEIRVIVERWDAGKLAELPVFHQTIRPMEIIGQPVSIGTIPVAWPGDVDLSKENDPSAKVKELAMQQREWMPLLQIGSKQIHQGSFTDQGIVNQKPDLDALGKTGKTARSIAGKAADALGDNSAPEVKQTGILTAGWLEYEIRVPGELPRRIRREIFDVIGPASRAAGAVARVSPDNSSLLHRNLALLGQTDILPLACQVSPAFVDMLSATNLLRIQKPLLMLINSDGSDRAGDNVISGEMSSVPQMPAKLYDVALSRAVLNPHHADVYLDCPNVLTCHRFPEMDGAGQIESVAGTDIVANEVAVRPGATVDPKQARLEQGVLDTNAEAIAQTDGVASSNASDVLDGQPDPSQWLVVKNANDPQWTSLKISADARARVDGELARGCTAIVPREPGAKSSINWWRIDPRTGGVLGIGERGWGPDMVEYGAITAYMFVGCLVGNKVATGRRPSGKAAAICAIVALGSALTLSSELTIAILSGFILVGAGTGAAIS